MYDDETQSTLSKPNETFELTGQIKNELFNVRDRLGPVLQPIPESGTDKPTTSTALIGELRDILNIVKAIRDSIYF